MVTVEVPSQLVGRIVKNLTITGEISVAAITRRGEAFIPLLGTEFRTNDLLHLVVLTSSMEQLKSLLGFGEGG